MYVFIPMLTVSLDEWCLFSVVTSIISYLSTCDLHCSHSLISEGNKGNAQPLHRDTVLLCIKLICQFLLQFTVILLCIHLTKRQWHKTWEMCIVSHLLAEQIMTDGWCMVVSSGQHEEVQYQPFYMYTICTYTIISILTTIMTIWGTFTCSKPHKSQQKICAQGWVFIMILPSFWALVVKYSLPFIAFRLYRI